MACIATVAALLLVISHASASESDQSSFSIKLRTSADTCYVREQITLELVIESTLTTVDIRFSKYDLGIPASFLDEILPVQREPGKVVLARNITPLAPGRFKIGPGRIYTTVMLPGGETGVSFKSATFASNDLVIDVKPLPKSQENRDAVIPAGEYDFHAIIDKCSAQVGETATISCEITGHGSMRTFSPPLVVSSDNLSAGLLRDQKIVTNEDGSATLTYRQDVTPLSSSVTSIPALSFTFFDPSSAEYRTIVQGPFPFDVRDSIRSLDTQGAGVSSVLAFEKNRNPGLMGIRMEVGRIRSETIHTIYTPAFWIIQSIPLLAVALSALYVTYRRRIESVEFRNYAKAYARAKREVRRAKKLLKAAQVRDCFNSLPKILAAYVGDKLNISSGGITNYEILRHVREHTKRKRFLRMIETLLGFINQARYTQEPLDPRKVRKWLKTTERALHYMEWHRIFRSAERKYIRALNDSGA